MDEKIQDNSNSPRAEHIHDLTGMASSDEKVFDSEEARHYQLTDAERAVEKKLRRKIDLRVMPLVVLVYLMNYIDRCVASFSVQRWLAGQYNRFNC